MHLSKGKGRRREGIKRSIYKLRTKWSISLYFSLLQQNIAFTVPERLFAYTKEPVKIMWLWLDSNIFILIFLLNKILHLTWSWRNCCIDIFLLLPFSDFLSLDKDPFGGRLLSLHPFVPMHLLRAVFALRPPFPTAASPPSAPTDPTLHCGNGCLQHRADGGGVPISAAAGKPRYDSLQMGRFYQPAPCFVGVPPSPPLPPF